MTLSDLSRQSHALVGRTLPLPFGTADAFFFISTSPAAQRYVARVARECVSDRQRWLAVAGVTASVQQALKQGDA
ncbi:hypothetical protein GGR70_001609 [Xanthomonas campestris]|nr:hypothetical protein [Xanthomonas campestris]